jgi:O-antigen ligase
MWPANPYPLDARFRGRRQLMPTWLQEWPFWVALVIWSFFPTRMTAMWQVFGVPVRNVDLLVILLTCLYGMDFVTRPKTRTGNAGWHGGLPIALGFTLLYALLSLAWSNLKGEDAAKMAYPLVSTAASAYLGYMLIAKKSGAGLREFLWRLTIFMAVVGAVYSAESLFSLGLRSPLATFTGDFGIERVCGPLFEASTGYFILLPALSFALQETIDGRVPRFLGGAVTFTLLVTILGLGSRAGILVLLLFLAIFAFVHGRRLGNALLVAALATCLAGAWLVVFSQAKTTRLTKTDDERSYNWATSWEIAAGRSLVANLAGSGYGSWWPWYATEISLEGRDIYKARLNRRVTAYGILLYHAHSTVLALVIELGLVGFLFAVKLLGTLFRTVLRSSHISCFAWGVAVSSISLLFDLFLFMRPTRDLVWWIYVFGLLRLMLPPRGRSTFWVKSIKCQLLESTTCKPGFRAIRFLPRADRLMPPRCGPSHAR